MFHFHGETEMPRSHMDPTEAFVDIPESLHEGAFNIVTARKAADSAMAGQYSDTSEAC
jgi:hypothetical protein